LRVIKAAFCQSTSCVAEFDSPGEDFEKKEYTLLGQDGFEKVVDKVAAIEKRLGIYDLAQFTPKIWHVICDLFDECLGATVLVRISLLIAISRCKTA